MKKIDIGKNKYRVIESADEMNYRRYLLLNQWTIMVFEEQDHSLFALTKDRVINHFNKGEYYQAINELTNSKFVKDLKEPDMSALGYCFALIVLDEGEDEGDKKNLDDGFLKEKISKWSDEGLTVGKMWEVFENFLMASPRQFAQFLEKLQVQKMMSSLLKEDQLLNYIDVMDNPLLSEIGGEKPKQDER